MIPDHAKKLGTDNALDRSKQYTRADNAELLRSLNEAWSQIRACKNELAAKDVQINELHRELAASRKQARRYRITTIALTSIITTLAWKGVEALMGTLR